MQDIYYASSDGEHTVHACIWQPEGKPKAVLQIIHGMEEYAARYSPFAEALAKQGFMVCAEDHLGHGDTVKREELGNFPVDHGENYVLKDIYSLTLKAKEAAPDIPYFVLGHSMGSFFCRAYLSEYGRGLSGAIIMGTGWQSRLLMDVAIDVTKIIGGVNGWNHRSKFITKLGFGSYNNKFKPARTSVDWLSVNEKNVDAYIADELCGFGFTCSGFLGLFRIIRRACSKKTFRAIPENLPVYVVSGDMDPVGGYGKGVKKVYSKLKKYGVKDVSITLYKGMRHEILNDDCGEKVAADIISFLNGKIS
ncbi:MAG: alpha/beta hydrolase [Clostridia bacterium]|nr:alpha/beta hydrolase [Clostridia bacterium]